MPRVDQVCRFSYEWTCNTRRLNNHQSQTCLSPSLCITDTLDLIVDSRIRPLHDNNNKFLLKVRPLAGILLFSTWFSILPHRVECTMLHLGCSNRGSCFIFTQKSSCIYSFSYIRYPQGAELLRHRPVAEGVSPDRVNFCIGIPRITDTSSPDPTIASAFAMDSRQDDDRLVVEQLSAADPHTAWSSCIPAGMMQFWLAQLGLQARSDRARRIYVYPFVDWVDKEVRGHPGLGS